MPKKKNPIVTEPILIRLSINMIKGIDLAMELGQGNSRSEIIRVAIANYLRELNITNDMKERKL
jgi:metal-responsive CopG/Arc/MetJ family transcriptional regulator